MEMCRFTGLDDVEYRKVASALRKIASSVSSRFKKGEKLPFNDEQRKTLLESLRFEQIDARQMTIKNAHAKTCKWLLGKSEYIDWLDPAKLDGHHGFLWIKGKPATGKSTLIKFALAYARRRMNDRVTISFFFNARGEGLEKSTLGAFQSLLLQLFERLPALQSVFDTLDLSTWSISANRRWSIESLKSLFEQAIQSLRNSSVVCFIDALDECNESQIREMLSFFEHIGELAVSIGAKFLVCFSSRHYPNIEIRRGLGLVLEGQEGHSQDIINYLDSELRIGHSKIAEQIRIDLKEKASEVFMWVVLVVEMLNKEHDGGRIHALRRRLKEIPGDLHELFRDMLTRDSDHRDELILCIQWVLFAKQPLGPEQLYFAILSGVEPQTLLRWDSDEVPLSTIKRFILNSSKGLVEITTSKTPRVQFIHESVRDFLLKENGLSKIWSDLGTNFQGQSHERLKQCCLNYMDIDFSTYPDISNQSRKTSSQEASAIRKSAACMFPFLEYATRHVLYHADVAEGYGIAQGRFIQSFQLKDWIRLDNLFEKHEVRRHTQDASLLYILAEANMPNLIKIHPSVLSSLKIEDERYGAPLLASLATRSEDAVRAFVKAYAAAQLSGSQLHGLGLQDYSHADNQRNLGRSLHFSKRRTVLSYLVECGDELLLSLVLGTGKFTPDFKDDERRTPLWWAANIGREAIVKLLLETGKVDINSKDNYGQTPLWLAAGDGHEAIVKLLLETGKVEIDSKDNDGRTPLLLAVGNGHEAIVKLLLETGKVDISSKDNYDRTPLWRAARNGCEAIVKLLLETGKVDISSKDNYDRTPLWWAARNGCEAIVKLLLETGKVEIDSKDNYGRTPLWWAAKIGHEAIVKLLLETGKVEIDSKDNYDRTPLWWAAKFGHVAIVKLLLETGKVEIDTKDYDGQTPLSCAAINGCEAIVKLLLETGKVEIGSKDNDGQTPLSGV